MLKNFSKLQRMPKDPPEHGDRAVNYKEVALAEYDKRRISASEVPVI